ncbi:PrsW family intramembrane metalloprotease [Microbacterium sp. W1N]|uniref:PrsW family intramembrane metalloprotease n=1 Tax=Microbacterium festucae TaxID=2977531 RepID=UPI0021C099F9|nr:PrsW family intramembrane metalloprotease [Microbacterium festucae]MCT9821538.1 PrsW family intramembrane metalloprotease [Microbacterium festucae]
MTFPSPLAQPEHGAGAPVPPSAGVPAVPVPARRGRRAPLWLFAPLAVLLAALAAYLLTFLGAEAAAVGMVLALVPLAAVLLAIRVVDRWEPEPRSLIVFAVAWGAVAAVALSLLIDAAVAVLAGDIGAASAVVQAPIVEELAKGVGVLIVFVVGRRAFDGPVDGVVYGALVGAGFAFTENILYFATSLIEGGAAEATMTFFLRGLLSPFAHVMFTAVTGFALGIAARRGARGSIAVAFAWGLAGAMLLHGLWNASAVYGDFFALYVTLQVPLFLVFAVGVLALRREEMRLTRTHLNAYAAAGWFSPAEVDMLATRGGRARAMAWARSAAPERAAAMRGFIADATGLAAARQRAVSGRDPEAAEEERVYLQRAVAARAALVG